MTSAPFFNQSHPLWQFVASLDQNNAGNNTNPNNASSSRQPRDTDRDNIDLDNNPLAFLFGGGHPFGRGGPWDRRGPQDGPADVPPPPPPPGSGPPPPRHGSHPPPPPPGCHKPPPPPAPPAVPPFEHNLPHRHRHNRHHGEDSGPSGDESRHRRRSRHRDSDDESDSPRRPHHRGGRHGPWGGRGGRHGPYGPPEWLQGLQGLDMSQLGEFIQAQLAAALPTDSNTSINTTRVTDGNTPAPSSSDHDFTPPVDVFDTETSYVVHVSLAGAKKEDLSVNWDAEKNELVVAGVVYRPGDEALLKTLALDERKVGAFERKVKLGGKEKKGEAVEVEGISAKMVDGVLVVVLPKKEGEWEKLFVVDVD